MEGMTDCSVFDVDLSQRKENPNETLASLIEESFAISTVNPCNNCGAEVVSRTLTRIVNPKDALVVCLNRFLNNPLWVENMNANRRVLQQAPALKNDRRVRISDRITLPLSPSGTVSFALTACAEHIGSIQSGMAN